MTAVAHADDLLALHRAGALVEQYPRVRSLLRGLSPADLDRAGRLLSRLQPADVVAAHPGTPVVRTLVAGHGTLGPLLPALTAEFARHGLVLDARLGDFDGYRAELADPATAALDLVVVLLDAAAVFDLVPVPWRPADVADVFAAQLALLERLVEGFTSAGPATLVLSTVPLPRQYPAQLLDHRSRAELGRVWRAANTRLLELAERHPSVVVVDLDPLVAEGVPVTDPRMGVYAKAHLSTELLRGYAREVGHLAKARAGRGRKVLALDLDETVWGGVLGEIGAEGVEVADTFRGEAFRAFQRVVKQLGAQGVLLAAVSKNDADAVASALAGNDRMTLREDDFVRVVANWRPKHDNIAELAADLNVGLDSVVFVDDNPFERGLVERELPDVEVVAVDDEAALHVARLLRDGWFDALALTDEDRARPRRYREDLERKDFLDSFDSLHDYLAGLGVRVDIAEAAEADHARISQITLRTNQFNLTTRRLAPPEVAAWPGTVLAIRSADRFGDNGLVGAVFLRRDGDTVHIDNFLLSCRVFSRGVETAALATVLRRASAAGAAAVTAAYRPSAKNGKVADFYPRNGFAATGDGGFRHDLTDLPAPPDHVELTGAFTTEGTP